MFLQLRNLKPDVAATVGDTLLLTDIRPTYRFDNNMRTNDVIGTTYEVLLADRQYLQLRVKVPGQRQIDPAVLEGQTPRVHVTGLELTPYAINGRTGVSAKAESIEIIDD